MILVKKFLDTDSGGPDRRHSTDFLRKVFDYTKKLGETKVDNIVINVTIFSNVNS